MAEIGGNPQNPVPPSAVRQELVRSHLPLVRSIARRYAGRGEELDDLVQAGSVGLVRASARFDPTRGVAFATFAAPAVEGEIRRHLRERIPGVRIPRSTPLDPDNPEREPAGESDPQSASEYRVLLAGGMRTLDERERRIVLLRFHADMTESQIAHEVGISQAHVSRLLEGALTKLRAELRDGDSTGAAAKSPAGPGTETKIESVGAEKSVGVQAHRAPDAATGRVGAEAEAEVEGEAAESKAKDYSGRFLVRMPSELHKQLVHAAERRRVSLNRYVTDTLSTSVGPPSPDRPGSAPEDRPAVVEFNRSPDRPRAAGVRMAIAANLAFVVVAGVVAVVLLVLALQRGI